MDRTSKDREGEEQKNESRQLGKIQQQKIIMRRENEMKVHIKTKGSTKEKK